MVNNNGGQATTTIMKSYLYFRPMVRRFKRRFWTDHVFCFGVSFLLGVFLAVILHVFQSRAPKLPTIAPRPYDFTYDKWIWQEQRARSVEIDPDLTRYNSSHLDEYTLDPESEASFLYHQVPITCVVFPETESGARTIKETWGRHCNQLHFFSHTLANASIPIQKIAAKSAFALQCRAFQAIHVQEASKAPHWTLVIAERTFVLVENLRYFVAPKNFSEPHYLGHGMQFWSEVYNWADAGYTLSQGAMAVFLKEFDSPQKCEKGGRFWKNGDWYLGKHLRRLGITPEDTRDHLGRGRFNGYSFKRLLFPGRVSVFERYWRDSLYLSLDGPHCCSNFAVTFHGILSDSKMYQLEYMFHHLRPFYGGGAHGNAPPKSHGPKPSYLTQEERLKDEARANFMSIILMTTPKSMPALMKPDVY